VTSVVTPLAVTFSRDPAGARVLVLDGYGLTVGVSRGHLVLADGLGSHRRTRRLPRAQRTVRRIVILGHTGHLSLEAVRWCTDTGITLTQLDTDGTLLLTAGGTQHDDPRLRRAQAAAATTPVGERIAEALLRAKLDGQRHVATTLGADTTATQIDQLAAQLGQAGGLAGMRNLEARAGNAYFAAWASRARCRFANKHRDRVPDHWPHFGARTSPLHQGGKSPRRAADPINALLNYTYALAESECRLALLALGLDPGLGIIHTDKKNRDSLALDLLEAVRPVVDHHVLQLLQTRHFTTDDFHETRDGHCRLLAPLSHHLAALLPDLAAATAPLAEQVAHALANASPSLVLMRTPLSRANYANAQAPARPKRTPRTPNSVATLPTCSTCGTQLYDKGRQLCTACWPATRNAHAELRNTASRAARAAAITAGNDPSQTTAARSKRRHSLLAAKAAEAAWASSGATCPVTEQQLREGVLPALREMPLTDMQRATGLSNSSCSRIRRGLMTPHPRHWGALAELAARGSPSVLAESADQPPFNFGGEGQDRSPLSRRGTGSVRYSVGRTTPQRS